MSGIAGLWRLDRRPGAGNDIARMRSAMRIYGPDASAQWAEADVAFARQLMRTLPEDAFDRQPLVGGDGRFVLVADVRLDNRDELAEALGIGDAARTCDAAFVLGAFERWGEDCVHHLVGDYAFALWDAGRRRLVLARDPMGGRPLHWFRDARCFAFASMPKGIHALPEVPYEANLRFFSEGLLYLADDGTRTCFDGIRKVANGQLVVVSRDDLTARRFWQPGQSTLRLARASDYAEAVRAQFDRALRDRLRGETQVAAHLSGGLDSGATTATAARLLDGTGKVHAFTSVPRADFADRNLRDRFADETAHAAATAALYPNVEHILVPTPQASALDMLDEVFHFHGQPIANPCNQVWLEAINAAASARGLRVLLTGAMGNLTASHDGMEAIAVLSRSGRWGTMARIAIESGARGTMRWRGALRRVLDPWMPDALWRAVALRHRTNQSQIFHDSPLRASLRAELLAEAAEHRMPTGMRYAVRDSVALRRDALQRTDNASFNKGILARWRLDCRDPFSDVRVAELCLAIPVEQFVLSGVPRALARAAFADRLPPLVIDETRRGYQGADWHLAFAAAPQALDAELDRIASCGSAADIVNIEALRRMARQRPTDEWPDAMILSHRVSLMRGISAGHFLRRIGGGNG